MCFFLKHYLKQVWNISVYTKDSVVDWNLQKWQQIWLDWDTTGTRMSIMT